MPLLTPSPGRRTRNAWKASIVILTIGLVAATATLQQPAIGAGQNFDPELLADPIAILQGQIDRGEVELDFSSPQGYLESVLEVLAIPLSSQTLVFSKTSFQAPPLISPETPRALYFNDDVYIGWVKGGPVVESAAVHPKFGTIFYTLDQKDGQTPVRAGDRTLYLVSPADALSDTDPAPSCNVDPSESLRQCRGSQRTDHDGPEPASRTLGRMVRHGDAR